MNNTKIYTPGEIICNLNDKVSGRGTYVIDNQIIASIIGCLAID
jgi:exosome complex RNA-binding protein Rrp4